MWDDGAESLPLSNLGVGTYSFSGVYGRKSPLSLKQTIERAYAEGINFFDTSDSYGGAEEFLGEVIKPFRREIYLATKLGVKPDLPSPLSHDQIIHSCEESLKQLQTDYLDIYLVHFHDPHVPVQETIGALETILVAGKIRTFGLGHLSQKWVQEYLKEKTPSFLFMELSAAVPQARKDLLFLCKQHGIGGVAFSVTGRSILTGKEPVSFEADDIRSMDPLFRYNRREWAQKVMEKLKEIGVSYQKSSVQVAIAWVLSQEGIVSALTGPSTPEHLLENLGGCDWTLTEEDRDHLDDFLARGEEELKKKIGN